MGNAAGSPSSSLSSKTQFELTARDDPSQLALIVGGSVFVFLLTFMSAHAWVVTAQWLMLKKDKRYLALGITCGLTVLTFGLAYGFAFASSTSKVRLPLDISGVIANSGLDVQQKREQEDAAAAAKLRQAVLAPKATN